jgi:hypothetical protein
MRLIALLYWHVRRRYLQAVHRRIPLRHPESWITVSEIAECDRQIRRLNARLNY